MLLSLPLLLLLVTHCLTASGIRELTVSSYHSQHPTISARSLQQAFLHGDMHGKQPERLFHSNLACCEGCLSSSLLPDMFMSLSCEATVFQSYSAGEGYGQSNGSKRSDVYRKGTKAAFPRLCPKANVVPLSLARGLHSAVLLQSVFPCCFRAPGHIELYPLLNRDLHFTQNGYLNQNTLQNFMQ